MNILLQNLIKYLNDELFHQRPAIERVVVYITRPISLGTEGLQLIVSGGQCSYTLVIPNKEGKVKEIIHNKYYIWYYKWYYIKKCLVSVNHHLFIYNSSLQYMCVKPIKCLLLLLYQQHLYQILCYLFLIIYQVHQTASYL